MNYEKVILECLEKHPGASSNRVLKFCNLVNKELSSIGGDHSKSYIFKNLRILRKNRKVINKGNSWYVIK
ncbi:hypothetical protein [Alkalihalobacillus deserti]|uniref:hypothetical protein n=1 Tax=Alkalihalobacillus deserti TaxID=2879466 RepID=UPI001D14EDBD|nr:hypothetical protein [Alkalihalobacillus deserti]